MTAHHDVPELHTTSVSADKTSADTLPDSAQGSVYWTAERRQIAEWLAGVAPSLAELYRGVVDLIYGPYLPGRVRFICQGVREIRNRLPEAIAPTEKGYLQYSNEIAAIARVWDQQTFALGGQPINSTALVSPSKQSPDPFVPMPPAVYQMLADLLARHRTTNGRTLEDALRLFVACYPESKTERGELRPTAELWVTVTDWFMARAHDSWRTDAECDENDLRRQFAIFDSVLASLSLPFYDVAREIHAILDIANS